MDESRAQSSGRMSVVIVAWNPGPLVGTIMDALNAQSLPSFQVVWVDNGSSDQSLAAVRAYAWRAGIAAAVVALPENLGVAGGRMAGIGAADGSLLGFLDADAVPASDWAERALELSRTLPERVGIFASWVEFPDGRLNGFGARLDRFGHGWDVGIGLDPADPAAPPPTAGPVDYAMGCGMVVRAGVCRRLDLDPALLKWHDDSELALQARALGWEAWRRPELRVVHLKGHADRALAAAASDRAAAHFELSERARVRLLLKYYPWSVVAAGAMRDAVSGLRSVRRPAVMRALWRAWQWNLGHLSSALQYRRRWRPALRHAGWVPGSAGTAFADPETGEMR